jgi:DNA-binding NarL/FixJ family response regulator
MSSSGRGGHADSQAHEASLQPVLDPEEARVLQLMATGRGTREVAERLDLPVEAVRALVEGILTKLGARSRIEALIIAIRAGLIETGLD